MLFNLINLCFRYTSNRNSLVRRSKVVNMVVNDAMLDHVISKCHIDYLPFDYVMQFFAASKAIESILYRVKSEPSTDICLRVMLCDCLIFGIAAKSFDPNTHVRMLYRIAIVVIISPMPYCLLWFYVIIPQSSRFIYSMCIFLVRSIRWACFFLFISLIFMCSSRFFLSMRPDTSVRIFCSGYFLN